MGKIFPTPHPQQPPPSFLLAPRQAPRWGGVWLAKTEGMVLGWGIPPPYPSTPWGPTSAHLKRAEGGSGWPFEGHPLRPAPGQLLRSCPAALLQGGNLSVTGSHFGALPAVRGPGAGAYTHFSGGVAGRPVKSSGGVGTRAKPPAPILSGREGGSGWPSDGRPLGPAPGSLAAKGHLSATGSHFGVLPAVRRWLATT